MHTHYTRTLNVNTAVFLYSITQSIRDTKGKKSFSYFLHEERIKE